MAVMKIDLPEDIEKDIRSLSTDSKKIFRAMTEAGAKVAYRNVEEAMPQQFKSSDIAHCLKISRTYETPSDGGINTWVGFAGYFTNRRGIDTPAPLVANVFEFGTSRFAKRPFFRKAFDRAKIEEAMMRAQKEASGGLLE